MCLWVFFVHAQIDSLRGYCIYKSFQFLGLEIYNDAFTRCLYLFDERDSLHDWFIRSYALHPLDSLYLIDF